MSSPSAGADKNPVLRPKSYVRPPLNPLLGKEGTFLHCVQQGLKLKGKMQKTDCLPLTKGEWALARGGRSLLRNFAVGGDFYACFGEIVLCHPAHELYSLVTIIKHREAAPYLLEWEDAPVGKIAGLCNVQF